MLKTVLTYLELDGFLLQGTPFYAGYSVRPTSGSLDDVFAAFDPDRAAFLERVVATGKTGRIWTSIDPEAAAAALGEERERVVAALGYLEQQGLVELKPSEARQRYTLLARPDSIDALLDRLVARFEQREQAETARIQQVVSLVTHDGCQVNELVGYFGEERDAPCGHCSFCLTASGTAASAARAAAGDRDARRPRRARRARRDAPRRTRRAAAARTFPLRDHEPGDEPREAHARTAVRRARHTALRRRAALEPKPRDPRSD